MAYRLYSKAYASCAAHEVALIDGEGASALVVLQQFGQWLDLVGTPAAPDAWEPWFIHETIRRIGDNSHPNRQALYDKQALQARADALGTYSNKAIDYVPSAADAYVYTIQTARNYVVNNCAKMPRPFFPSMSAVDSAMDETIGYLWNRSRHIFRQRPVTVTIDRIAFTTATWTESTKTLTQASAFANLTHAAGIKVYVTGGTSANTGEYIEASKTSDNAITLVSSLSATAGNLSAGDITGYVVQVTMRGLDASETFDSIQSPAFYYTDTGYEACPCNWASPRDMAAMRSADGTNAARPRFFRIEMYGQTIAWQLSPPPDTDYEMRGQVFVSQPAKPTAVTDTFARFALECQPLIKRMTLCRTLTNAGRHDENLARECEDEAASLWPIATEAGAPELARGVTDVYGDIDRASQDGVLGGAF